MTFRIRSVDMNGATGRKNHPTPSDEGLFVSPIKMVAYIDKVDDVVEAVKVDGKIDEDAPESAHFEINEEATSFTRVWTCLTEDGRVLDLMDYELEVWRS